jgi:hypothetical protein
VAASVFGIWECGHLVEFGSFVKGNYGQRSEEGSLESLNILQVSGNRKFFYNPLSGFMGVAQNTGTGRYCDDTAGYRYRQKKCYRHIPRTCTAK